MKKCHIVTAYVDGPMPDMTPYGAPECIICADGGHEIALSNGMAPSIVIGDSDSGEMKPRPGSKTEFIRFPQEKDESDTFLCVKHAISLGYDDITIIGGVGGRVDHTVSNIQTLTHFSSPARRIAMVDANNYMTVIEGSSITLSGDGYVNLSLFSLTDRCTGVTAKGLHYPLDGADLDNAYPIGLSNRFTGGEAVIGVKAGKLLAIMSRI